MEESFIWQLLNIVFLFMILNRWKWCCLVWVVCKGIYSGIGMEIPWLRIVRMKDRRIIGLHCSIVWPCAGIPDRQVNSRCSRTRTKYICCLPDVGYVQRVLWINHTALLAVTGIMSHNGVKFNLDGSVTRVSLPSHKDNKVMQNVSYISFHITLYTVSYVAINGKNWVKQIEQPMVWFQI